MIREELEHLKTGRPELRKFGLVVGAAFLLVSFWLGWRGKAAYVFLLAPGIALAALGVFVPQSLRRVYRWWMAMAFVLGWIVSSVVLVLFFYFVVTPVGLLARAVGKDFLSRRFARQASSYWMPRERSQARAPESYERQF